MICFENDYCTGACEEILKKLSETNLETTLGYGSDPYTISAIEKIKMACDCPEAEVYLAVGGTQTNQLVISTMLRDYEGVVAAQTGHVALHEAGAIEYSGHKVLTIPGHEGKMDAGELKEYLDTFFSDGNHEHMVFPGMVYISHPTEYGTLYTKAEMEAIKEVCKAYDLPLYLDGARLAYALASHESELDLPTIAKICDVFYIGATKAGALLGEAIVFTGNNMPKHFLTMAKQRGALLAKGRLLGIQFDVLFTDNVFLKNGAHAIKQKDKLVAILKKHNLQFFIETPTNQQFVILENSMLQDFEKEVQVCFWEKYDENHSVVRFATTWSTSDEDLANLDKMLLNYAKKS